jgi:uncharacterized membrane protein
MIEAHVADAWVSLSERGTSAFRSLIVVGGYAAPMFLWLAGLSLVLAAERRATLSAGRRAIRARLCRRGLEIFALAFLFRLQAFVVTPGGPWVSLLRVDILNVMGPALVATGLIWGRVAAPAALAATYLLGAAAACLVTPVVRTAGWVDSLPGLVQWYLRPSGSHTTFTLFPWCGFVFAGAAAGVLLARAVDGRRERETNLGFAVLGLAAAAAGFYLPSLLSRYGASAVWAGTSGFFVLRVGVLMLVLATLYGLDRLSAGRQPPPLVALQRFGSSSLFVYWIHVELVYGYATAILHKGLSLGQAAVAYGAFCCAMYGAILLRDWVVRAVGQMDEFRLPALRYALRARKNR